MKTYEERIIKENELLELISKAKDILYELDDDEKDRPYDEMLDIFYWAVRQGWNDLYKVECMLTREFAFCNEHS